MRTIEQFGAIQPLKEEREQRRAIARLVDALMHIFRIPEGDALVWWLGNGSERNNREALFHWTKHELDAPVPKVAFRNIRGGPHVSKTSKRLHYDLYLFVVVKYSSSKKFLCHEVVGGKKGHARYTKERF